MRFKLAANYAPDQPAILPADAHPGGPSYAQMPPLELMALMAAVGAQMARTQDAASVPREVWLQRPWPQFANPPVPPTAQQRDEYAIAQHILSRSATRRDPTDYLRIMGADPAIRRAATTALLPALLGSDALGGGQGATAILRSLSNPTQTGR